MGLSTIQKMVFTTIQWLLFSAVSVTGGLYWYERGIAPTNFIEYVSEISTKDTFSDEHMFFYSFRKIEGDGIQWNNILWCDSGDGRGIQKVDHVYLVVPDHSYPENEALNLARDVINSGRSDRVELNALREIPKITDAYRWRWKGGFPEAESSECHMQTFYETITPIFHLPLKGVSVSNTFTVLHTEGVGFKALEQSNSEELERLTRSGDILDIELQENN